MTYKRLVETLACCIVGTLFGFLLWHMAANW
jgi:F0F1-type ATP synthase assembly protein I